MKPVDGMPWPWIRTAMSTWFTSRTRVTSSGTASMTGRVGVSSGIKNCGKTYCWDVHMVIDGNDELHVAARPTPARETLEYMHYDGTTWTSTEVTPSALFGPVGIAVDSNNHPHISYAANGQYCGNGLRLASHDGTGWSSQGVDVGSNRGCESSILIDEDDHVYIAYQDRSASKLKIATDKNGQWDDYTVNTEAIQATFTLAT